MRKWIACVRRIPAEVGQVLLAVILLLSAVFLPAPSAVSFCLYLAAALAAGWRVLIDAARNILRRDFLDEKFLMCIAAIGAFAIGEYPEGTAVMIFYRIGESFEHYAVRRSRRSIRALMDICPDRAIVLREGVECEIAAEELLVGDTILLRAGDRVPADCVVTAGSGSVNTAALTGESLPVGVEAGCELQSGTVNVDGVLQARVLRPSDESAASRVLALVEEASERKSRQENFITRFSRVYTPCVVGAALLLAFFAPLIAALATGSSYAAAFPEWFHRALMFLVVSCPCALVISVPLTFFGGVGGAARRGILFKGGHSFDSLACARIAAFDKTGTLTSGRFSVVAVEPCAPYTEQQLLRYAAALEKHSSHPLARAIAEACPDAPEASDCRELPGQGVVGQVDGFPVGAGNLALLRSCGVERLPTELRGAVYVAIGGQYAGAVLLADAIKPEAAEAISDLHHMGVARTVMLTGDGEATAAQVAAAVGMDEFHAKLQPKDKYDALEGLMAAGQGNVLYVGDGINDAPVLTRADVGIAMGGIGSDAAIEAADVVLMSDNLSRVPEAIGIARRTLRIARQNIVFALAVKFAILLLCATGVTGAAGMWLAVCADVGVSVVAILNATRALR